jgi:hypothetical protein
LPGETYTTTFRPHPPASWRRESMALRHASSPSRGAPGRGQCATTMYSVGGPSGFCDDLGSRTRLGGSTVRSLDSECAREPLHSPGDRRAHSASGESDQGTGSSCRSRVPQRRVDDAPGFQQSRSRSCCDKPPAPRSASPPALLLAPVVPVRRNCRGIDQFPWARCRGQTRLPFANAGKANRRLSCDALLL